MLRFLNNSSLGGPLEDTTFTYQESCILNRTTQSSIGERDGNITQVFYSRGHQKENGWKVSYSVAWPINYFPLRR